MIVVPSASVTGEPANPAHVGPAPGEVQVTAGAESLEGRWLAKFSEVPSFPGGIDGFFNAQLVLTAKAEAAKAAYDAEEGEGGTK